MNTSILIESRNFKAFLKENYPVVLDSCYLFTKKIMNMELNTVSIVFMEFALHIFDIPELYSRFNEYFAI